MIHLKRHCGDVADTTFEELVDWLHIVRLMEKALRGTFDATMFNWSCYMNHSYRDTPPDPHIHWWVVPRYNHPVWIGDWVFEDVEFGNPYDHHNQMQAPPELHNEIAKRIRQAIEQDN